MHLVMDPTIAHTQQQHPVSSAGSGSQFPAPPPVSDGGIRSEATTNAPLKYSTTA